eukprot:m.23062 g.23062  ORF g.23062 m.23062 type:complete len:193 (-) comp11327_c0_seq1:481-1059(-)
MASFDLLMQAPNKEFVHQLFHTGFGARKSSVPEAILNKAAEALEASSEAVGELFAAIIALINRALFENVSSKEQLVNLLPSQLNDKLKKLVVTVIGQNLPTWREQAATDELSLPKLKAFDWRVDVKTASDQMARMNMPTALIHLAVQDSNSGDGSMTGLRDVAFEVNKDTLGTMLDGLSKIQEQLASVAGSS